MEEFSALELCGAKITKVGESSRSEEAAEPMETYSGMVLSRAQFKAKYGGGQKPKIEGPLPEILKAPEWDVDSFDGLDYYSSPEYDSSSGDDDTGMERYRLFKRQIIKSKGFYADPEICPGYYYKQIYPVSMELNALPGKNFAQYWEDMVHICLQKFNQDKGTNVEFVEVVRGNRHPGPRSKSYITFMAREKPDGPLVEYQAKCMVTIDRIRHPILCRPAPTQKLSKELMSLNKENSNCPLFTFLG